MNTNLTEITRLFDIARDLAAARLAAAKAAEDIEFHLNEITAIRMHTENARVRAVCECVS